MSVRLRAAATATVSAARPAWVAAGTWRRLDPLSRLACTAIAGLPAAGGRAPGDWPEQTALVLGTAFGAVASTGRFLDSIAAHGDAQASPTPFTSSVHNASTGAIGELLGLRGPASTVTGGGCSGGAALRWAWLQLAAGRCRSALVLIGDALDDWACGVIASLVGDGRRIAQGLVALELTVDGTGRPLRPARDDDDVLQLDAGGIGGEEARLQAAAGPERQRADATGWSPTAAWWTLPDLAPEQAVVIREREGLLEQAWYVGPPAC